MNCLIKTNLSTQLPSCLKGRIKILSYCNGLPIVFLFDESHDNKNKNINKNIENAKLLVDKLNVKIIGVESYSGGYEWDQYEERYTETFIYGDVNSEPVNCCLDFTNNLIGESNINIYGIESFGMLSKMQNDLCDSESLYFQMTPNEHPLNTERSKHFIKTLLKCYTDKRICGNLILNCGKNHLTSLFFAGTAETDPLIHSCTL